MNELKCFLDHFLAKCSMSDRPGLDVRARFWPETLSKYLLYEFLLLTESELVCYSRV